MIDAIIESFYAYYGLDWLALLCGVIGMYLITLKSRIGFLFSGLSCMSGFAVAMISLQFGFVAYNIILLSMMTKGYIEWGRDEDPHNVDTGASLKTT